MINLLGCFETITRWCSELKGYAVVMQHGVRCQQHWVELKKTQGTFSLGDFCKEHFYDIMLSMLHSVKVARLLAIEDERFYFLDLLHCLFLVSICNQVYSWFNETSHVSQGSHHIGHRSNSASEQATSLSFEELPEPIQRNTGRTLRDNPPTGWYESYWDTWKSRDITEQ